MAAGYPLHTVASVEEFDVDGVHHSCSAAVLL